VRERDNRRFEVVIVEGVCNTFLLTTLPFVFSINCHVHYLTCLFNYPSLYLVLIQVAFQISVHCI
jgi:hypothetical protein